MQGPHVETKTSLVLHRSGPARRARVLFNIMLRRPRIRRIFDMPSHPFSFRHTCHEPSPDSPSTRAATFAFAPWTVRRPSIPFPSHRVERPNSFCIARNQAECHYSVRRITGPRPDSTSRRAFKVFPDKAARAIAPSSGRCDDNGGSGGGSGLNSERRRLSKLPLKR